MIELKKIGAAYPGKVIFEDMNLSLPETGAVALMGPSGCGKTTLLRLLAGLTRPTSGAIVGMQGKKVAFLFQEDRLLPWRTALENAALPGNKTAAEDWLRRMEITQLNAYPAQLSGGMQRRVALARALAFQGDALLLDEPFKGLDEALRGRIIEKIRRAAPLILLTTHDEAEARAMDAQVIRLGGAVGGTI